mmetsp:Transcript_5897/g.9476  ORF Transcript_5897/g.9476 Transcript_5897/m.9476 type:complete len:331 (-) Transcript_5897:78-1070(-)
MTAEAKPPELQMAQMVSSASSASQPVLHKGRRTTQKSTEFVIELAKLEDLMPSQEAIDRVEAMLSCPSFEYDHMDVMEFANWFSLVAFREELMLTQEQCVYRKYAREFGVSIDVVDDTRQFFRMFDDTEDDGNIDYDTFKKVVHKLMKIPANCTLPESRLSYFWSEIEQDDQGEVQFGHFLAWWLKYFDGNEKEMPFETYYKHVRRLGPAHLDPPPETYETQSDGTASVTPESEPPERSAQEPEVEGLGVALPVLPPAPSLPMKGVRILREGLTGGDFSEAASILEVDEEDDEPPPKRTSDSDVQDSDSDWRIPPSRARNIPRPNGMLSW